MPFLTIWLCLISKVAKSLSHFAHMSVGTHICVMNTAYALLHHSSVILGYAYMCDEHRIRTSILCIPSIRVRIYVCYITACGFHTNMIAFFVHTRMVSSKHCNIFLLKNTHHAPSVTQGPSPLRWILSRSNRTLHYRAQHASHRLKLRQEIYTHFLIPPTKLFLITLPPLTVLGRYVL